VSENQAVTVTLTFDDLKLLAELIDRAIDPKDAPPELIAKVERAFTLLFGPRVSVES